MATSHPLRFGPFVLDVASGRLTRHGDEVELRPRPYALLVALASRAGEVVAKDALLDAVWGTRFVTEGVIKTAVAELRAALGDDPRDPRWIHTLPRRGYRFDPGEAAGPGTPPSGTGTRFVGRASALVWLQDHWRQACEGQRGLLLLAGEAGVGKTALLEQFVATLDDARVLPGTCIEARSGSEPYQPLLDALDQQCEIDPGLVDSLRHMAPTWLLQMPWRLDASLRATLQAETAGASRERMQRELTAWIEGLAKSQPVLLVLEDAHWADAATVQWLDALARRRTPARLLVLASIRSTELALTDAPMAALRSDLLPPRLAHERMLEGLSVEDVGELVRQRLPPSAADEGARGALVQGLHRFTGGLPLFVLGVLDEWRATDGGTLQVPQRLEAVAERTLRRLAPETQGLLEAAALASGEFDHCTLAAVTGQPEDRVRDTLEQLIRQGVWLRASGRVSLPDGRVALRCSFDHALVRHALAERVGPVRQVDLHRRFAAALAQSHGARTEVWAPELARHHQLGQEPLAAARQWAVVARVALQRQAPREALASVAQALSLIDESAPTDLRLSLESARLTATLQSEGMASAAARAQVGELLSRVGTLPVDDVTLPLWQVLLLTHLTGRLEGTSSLVARFAERTASGSALAQAVAANAEGVDALHLDRPHQALRSFLRALALCDQDLPTVALLRDPRADAWSYLCLTATVCGEDGLALHCTQAIDRLVAQEADLITVGMGRWFQVYAAYYRDEPAAVLPLARSTIELLEARRFSPFVQPLRMAMGWALAATGQPQVGLGMARAALQQYRDQGSRQGLAGLCMMVAEAARLAGDTVLQGELLDTALEAAEKVGDHFARSDLWRMRASWHAGRQAGALAAEAHDQAVALARASGSALWAARIPPRDALVPGAASGAEPVGTEGRARPH